MPMGLLEYMTNFFAATDLNKVSYISMYMYIHVHNYICVEKCVKVHVHVHVYMYVSKQTVLVTESTTVSIVC